MKEFNMLQRTYRQFTRYQAQVSVGFQGKLNNACISYTFI